MSVISKKICMVGDFGVGKTSLVRRFLDRQFSDHYLSTIGVKISRKLVAKPQNTEQDLQLMIWDVEGRTSFQSITPHYLEGAMGAVIVADLNRAESIENIPAHLELLASVNSRPMPYVVALNKVDVLGHVPVAATLIAELQTNPQIVTVCRTSAKTGQGVDQMFELFAQRLLEYHHSRSANAPEMP
jgi:small GTP-binding protein